MLAGSALGMILLAIGGFAERQSLPNVRSAISLAAWLAILASLLCFAGAVVKGREAHALAGMVIPASACGGPTVEPSTLATRSSRFVRP